MTPNGPNPSASNVILERPQSWAYYHPFRLYFCGVTSTMPISYEMRIEIENKSIAQFSMADGYHQVRTFNWMAHVCYGEGLDDPICWDKVTNPPNFQLSTYSLVQIRKSEAIMICLESGVTKAHINFYFPGSGTEICFFFFLRVLIYLIRWTCSHRCSTPLQRYWLRSNLLGEPSIRPLVAWRWSLYRLHSFVDARARYYQVK